MKRVLPGPTPFVSGNVSLPTWPETTPCTTCIYTRTSCPGHCCCSCTRRTILQINTNNFDFVPLRRVGGLLAQIPHYPRPPDRRIAVEIPVPIPERVTFNRSIQIKLYLPSPYLGASLGFLLKIADCRLDHIACK